MSKYTYDELIEIKKHFDNIYEEMQAINCISSRHDRYLSDKNRSHMKRLRIELTLLQMATEDAIEEAGVLFSESIQFRSDTAEL